MPFEWKGFLALARNLEQQAAASVEPEPLRCSAVSRAISGPIVGGLGDAVRVVRSGCRYNWLSEEGDAVSVE